MGHSFLEPETDPASKEQISRLENGSILLARDVLQDINFSATVVLICVYAPEGGTYGLVLNRPSHMPLSEIFDGVADSNDRREISIGGPVQQEELQVVRIADDASLQSFQIAPRVHLGGKWENVNQMLSLDPATTKLFLGYSGWAPGQLENEIMAGAWDVYHVDVEKLLMNLHKTVSSNVNEVAAFIESLRVDPKDNAASGNHQ
jgi:putative transcriptional regulator